MRRRGSRNRKEYGSLGADVRRTRKTSRWVWLAGGGLEICDETTGVQQATVLEAHFGGVLEGNGGALTGRRAVDGWHGWEFRAWMAPPAGQMHYIIIVPAGQDPPNTYATFAPRRHRQCLQGLDAREYQPGSGTGARRLKRAPARAGPSGKGVVSVARGGLVAPCAPLERQPTRAPFGCPPVVARQLPVVSSPARLFNSIAPDLMATPRGGVGSSFCAHPPPALSCLRQLLHPPRSRLALSSSSVISIRHHPRQLHVDVGFSLSHSRVSTPKYALKLPP
ncbi:hypothetical protein PCL_06645 [Purpureocillium lilacinum]|uniref:Uncharacterized protein n=1 Tax=Purpureocillium lilacinum TaxID=33203 RepID=A0A2U3ENA4_PURLI|nr:hypothetical protein PCL_06645 [Purpureocillium lilacinum]